MIKVGDLAHQSFLQFPVSVKLENLRKTLMETNCRYVLGTFHDQIKKVVLTPCLIQGMIQKGMHATMEDLISERFVLYQNTDPISSLLAAQGNMDLVVVLDEGKSPVGLIDNLSGIKRLMGSLLETVPGDSLSLMEYRNIVEQFGEEIFVTDGEGVVLYLNATAEKVCQVELAEVVGKHVSELEKAGVFSASSTAAVLKTGKRANLLQKLKSGKTVFATGFPVFDQTGRLVRVLNTSKDIKEINHLIEEIEQKDREIKNKNQELNLLREGIFAQDNFVCNSPKMLAIKRTILKVAPTDITVLLQGESGVGKEVVTKLIHNLSLRNRYPLVKINCGLIPENLMESELFGYEGGAFTGANKNGKVGKVELANHGTLFLDEIGEMPLSLQVKLLEFLQDREITRVGGTNKIKIDTRVVVATNRDLQSMVDQGSFRRDLFYRLNVLPIHIPPLRERQEDISLLAEYFLDQFNNKYKMNKKLAPEVRKAFSEYDWPGNVRELIHFIERLMVISDSEVITPENLPEILLNKNTPYQKIICTDLMPLKKAKNQLEAQLVKRAYEIYKSTYKVGEVLEIDQSTVVKLLKKYR